MHYNWEFVLKARAEGEAFTGVKIGEFDLDVRGERSSIPRLPQISIDEKFTSITRVQAQEACLTPIESIFMEYISTVDREKIDDRPSRFELEKILSPYVADIKNAEMEVSRRCSGRKYGWTLSSSGFDENSTASLTDAYMEMNILDTAKFVLAPEKSWTGNTGRICVDPSVLIKPEQLPTDIHDVVRFFYEAFYWARTNPRHNVAMLKLLDELDRLEEMYSQKFHDRGLDGDSAVAKDPAASAEKHTQPVAELTQYNYLVVFQDLMAPQATPMSCRWIGSFEVYPLYNVAVYRTPAENFGLMFVLDSNVHLDAVQAGARGAGLAAKLSKLAVTQDDHTYREWSAVTEQLRACFE